MLAGALAIQRQRMLTNKAAQLKSHTSRELANARLPSKVSPSQLKQPAKPEPCCEKSTPVASDSRPVGSCKSQVTPRTACVRSPCFNDGALAFANPSYRFGLCSPPFPISQHKQTGLLVRMERQGAFPTRRFSVDRKKKLIIVLKIRDQCVHTFPRSRLTKMEQIWRDSSVCFFQCALFVIISWLQKLYTPRILILINGRPFKTHGLSFMPLMRPWTHYLVLNGNTADKWTVNCESKTALQRHKTHLLLLHHATFRRNLQNQKLTCHSKN